MGDTGIIPERILQNLARLRAKWLFPLDAVGLNRANGGRRVRAAPTTLGPETKFETVLRVNGDSAKGTHMSITFDTPQTIPDPANVQRNPQVPPPCVAKVRWGNSGFYSEALVDVKQGTVITVPAGMVEVGIANLDEGFDDPDAGPQPPQDANVGAFIAYLPYFKPGNATFTIDDATAIPDGTVGPSFLIPDYAIETTLLVVPGVGFNDPQLQYQDLSGVVLANQSGFGSVNPSPIPNKARQVAINNIAGGGTITRAQYIFELSF